VGAPRRWSASDDRRRARPRQISKAFRHP
jgi:hypothetical protein